MTVWGASGALGAVVAAAPPCFLRGRVAGRNDGGFARAGRGSTAVDIRAGG